MPGAGTGPNDEIVQLVIKRAAGGSEEDPAVCEHCSEPLKGERGRDWVIHHRRPRRRGGSRLPDTNHPQNLVAVCAASHDEIESHRADALAHGWLLHAKDDPLHRPILLYRGSRWAYLTADAAISDTPPREEGWR